METSKNKLKQKGVRQGCKAAPYLWCVLTDELFCRISAVLGSLWVRTCMTLYADDLCVHVTFCNSHEPYAELEKIGQVLDLVEDLGLPICDDKSNALVAIGGTDFQNINPRYNTDMQMEFR